MRYIKFTITALLVSIISAAHQSGYADTATANLGKDVLGQIECKNPLECLSKITKECTEKLGSPSMNSALADMKSSIPNVKDTIKNFSDKFKKQITEMKEDFMKSLEDIRENATHLDDQFRENLANMKKNVDQQIEQWQKAIKDLEKAKGAIEGLKDGVQSLDSLKGSLDKFANNVDFNLPDVQDMLKNASEGAMEGLKSLQSSLSNLKNLNVNLSLDPDLPDSIPLPDALDDVIEKLNISPETYLENIDELDVIKNLASERLGGIAGSLGSFRDTLGVKDADMRTALSLMGNLEGKNKQQARDILTALSENPNTPISNAVKKNLSNLIEKYSDNPGGATGTEKARDSNARESVSLLKAGLAAAQGDNSKLMDAVSTKIAETLGVQGALGGKNHAELLKLIHQDQGKLTGLMKDLQSGKLSAAQMAVGGLAALATSGKNGQALKGEITSQISSLTGNIKTLTDAQKTLQSLMDGTLSPQALLQDNALTSVMGSFGTILGDISGVYQNIMNIRGMAQMIFTGVSPEIFNMLIANHMGLLQSVVLKGVGKWMNVGTSCTATLSIVSPRNPALVTFLKTLGGGSGGGSDRSIPLFRKTALRNPTALRLFYKTIKNKQSKRSSKKSSSLAYKSLSELKKDIKALKSADLSMLPITINKASSKVLNQGMYDVAADLNLKLKTAESEMRVKGYLR